MCKWGTDVELELTIVKELSYSGVERKKNVKVDQCIAPIIRVLNDGGIITTYSCCGHGTKDGIIVLKDGRSIIIKPDIDWERNDRSKVKQNNTEHRRSE